MCAKIVIAALVAAIALGWAAWDQVRVPPPAPPAAPAPPGRVWAGLSLPAASFVAPGGRHYNLHDFGGRVIVLNFWATWCPPCVAELPQMIALAAAHPDRMVLVALSADEEEKAMLDFIEKLPAPLREKARAENVVIAHDPGRAISRDIFQTLRYPETYIAGPDLVIREKVVGLTEWTAGRVLGAEGEGR